MGAGEASLAPPKLELFFQPDGLGMADEEPQAGGVSQALTPPLTPGLPRSPKPYKARPSGREQDRHKGGAPSQLDSAPLRAASQSGAGPGGGAQTQGRVGAVGRLARPSRSWDRGAAS